MPAPAIVSNGQIPYETISVVIAPGDIVNVPGTLRYLTLLSATNPSTVLLSFNGASFFPFPPALNLSNFEANGVYIQNSGVAPNTVLIAKGMAEMRDNRVTVDAASPLPVTAGGTFPVAPDTTTATNADAVAALASDAMPAASYSFVYNGATWDRLRGSVTAGAFVDVKNVAGLARTADPAAVADGAAIRAMIDKVGRLVNAPYCLPENIVRGATAQITDTNDHDVIASPGAGKRLYVTAIHMINTDTTVSTEVVFKSGATEVFRGFLHDNAAVDGHPGMHMTFPVPIVCGVNEAFIMACGTASAEVRVAAFGYKGE